MLNNSGATIKPGTDPNGGSKNVVLAKGGIRLPEFIEDTARENDEIVRLFLCRTPQDQVTLRLKTGVRDIVTFDADLVDKSLTKRLSMEFDWKRRPFSAVQSTAPDHVAFSTEPWTTVDEFILMRRYWEEFAIDTPFCLKSLADYRQFATYVMSQSSLGKADSKYMRRDGGDLKRLRQSLGAAWRHSKAGLIWQQDDISNAEFASILSDAGIAATRADIENAARKPFAPKKCPPTPDVFQALSKLSQQFPSIEVDAFIANANRECDQAIIVFDKSSVAAPVLKAVGNISFRPQYGFIVIVDSLRGDYQNLGLAYLLARDLAAANPSLEVEHDLLLILMERIIADANRLGDIRSLVEDGIKKSQEVLSRLEQGRLSLEFCRSYLKKFLETGTLTRTDLLDFYNGGDVKAKYQAIHEDIKSIIKKAEEA